MSGLSNQPSDRVRPAEDANPHVLECPEVPVLPEPVDSESDSDESSAVKYAF